MEGILSGLIGAVIGASVSFLTLRYNYRDLYARNISQNRMDWINSFRDEIAIIVAAIECIDKKSEGKDIDNIVYKACVARAKLQTRLNMDIEKYGNEYNEAMSKLLNSIDFKNCRDCDYKENLVNNLVELTRNVLEPEWQRVKNEAGGK